MSSSANRDAPAIVANNAAKMFLDGAVVAFRQLSFAVQRNEILCVVGPSGCGKTTLLRCIAGLTDLSSGELLVQGKHRYFRLADDNVAAALESLMVVAGTPRTAAFEPSTPSRLRTARTCYDHMAGNAGVALHDRLHAQGWLSGLQSGSYELTPEGAVALESLGVEIDAVRRSRRRFACACLDWSERRPHLGGALGAAWLQLSLRRGWVRQALDGRELALTPKALRELPELFA